MDQNKKLAELLELIGSYYTLAKDKYRAKTFLGAAELITNHDEEITSGEQAQQLHGIGKSTGEVIDEYLLTGNVKRLIELEKKFVKEKVILDEFTSYYGIGPVTASNFLALGYVTRQDLLNKAGLTEAQRNGIIWHDHLSQRVDRSEMDLINKTISDILAPYNVKWCLAGSYRREESSSGDIDILIQKGGLTMDIIVGLLKYFLPVTFAKGEKKFAGIFRLSGNNLGHHIDILLIPEESWPFALLHFTGSGKFNVLMRQRAKEFGFKLSEYGLLNYELAIQTEENIFSCLRVVYVRPKDRTKTITSLTYS